METNIIYNEDCLEGMKKLPDKSINLIIIDPPYFKIKGEFDFGMTFEQWQELHEKLAKECQRVLTDNGSIFIYGHAKNIAYQQVIFDEYFSLLNNLVWWKYTARTNKGIFNYRCFAPVTERILFYSNDSDVGSGKIIYDKIMEENIKPKNKFAKYLRDEFERAKQNNINVRKIIINDLCLDSAMLNRWCEGSCIIKKEYYLKLREYLNNEYLKAEYEDLKAEYEELRRPFNNTKYTDILKFGHEANITGKYNHPTQKPPKLTRELIKITSKKNDIVLVPFVGSGVECEQALDLERQYIGFEIDKKYYNIAIERINKVKQQSKLTSYLE